MKEVTIEEMRRKAQSWQARGKKWHFHMLTLDCAFNERDDKYAFVLENSTDNQTYVAYSGERAVPGNSLTSFSAIDLPERYMEIGQEFVTMLYGDEILDKDKGATESSNEKMQAVLRRAKELNARNIFWHSHLLSPDCIFNKHKGKWDIVFEEAGKDEVIEVLYDEEPVEDLRRIEILYYEQEA
jgi:hypothetical protein